ncbi:MAG: hypothetical protein M1820_001706 [Bogoriella megaspora]|nr:MAG: hypothetical protein M1820_001706 [Bogoriella megaspora]
MAETQRTPRLPPPSFLGRPGPLSRILPPLTVGRKNVQPQSSNEISPRQPLSESSVSLPHITASHWSPTPTTSHNRPDLNQHYYSQLGPSPKPSQPSHHRPTLSAPTGHTTNFPYVENPQGPIHDETRLVSRHALPERIPGYPRPGERANDARNPLNVSSYDVSYTSLESPRELRLRRSDEPPQDAPPLPPLPVSASVSAEADATKMHLDYQLRVRQQPIAARACGYGERDRRNVDPPPILELFVREPQTDRLDWEEMGYNLNVLHCTLWHATKDEEVPPVPDQRRPTRHLMGSLVSSPFVAKDENHVDGSFFPFPDLSCRHPGKYRLHFVLMRIDPTNLPLGAINPLRASITSDVFTVYQAKDFPGMTPSSELTKALKRQGCNIQVKKGNEKRLGKGKTPEEEEDDDEADTEINSLGKGKRKRTLAPAE